MSAIVSAASDVAMTRFEVWGWVAVGVIALSLILTGMLFDDLGRHRVEQSAARRRERAEWANRMSSSSAAARAESLEQARRVGVARARQSASVEVAARADVIEQRRLLSGVPSHTRSSMPRRLVRDHHEGVIR